MSCALLDSGSINVLWSFRFHVEENNISKILCSFIQQCRTWNKSTIIVIALPNADEDGIASTECTFHLFVQIPVLDFSDQLGKKYISTPMPDLSIIGNCTCCSIPHGDLSDGFVDLNMCNLKCPDRLIDMHVGRARVIGAKVSSVAPTPKNASLRVSPLY